MTALSTRRYADLSSRPNSSRRRCRLGVERLEEIAAANSLQDLLVGAYLGEAATVGPMRASAGEDL